MQPVCTELHAVEASLFPADERVHQPSTINATMPSSFRKDASLAPFRYRTPSPPTYAFEPLSPRLNGHSPVEALGFDLQWANNDNGTRNGRKRPYIPQQQDRNGSHSGYRSSASAMDAFASIALATKTNGLYETNLSNNPQYVGGHRNGERPTIRARSEKLASPDWSRKRKIVDTRPATSYEQSPESRKLEAELLLNFAQEAAKYTSPSPVLSKASTSHMRSFSEASIVAQTAVPEHSSPDQRYAIADTGRTADDQDEHGPPFSPISNPETDDQPIAVEPGFDRDAASAPIDTVTGDRKPPDDTQNQIESIPESEPPENSQSPDQDPTTTHTVPDPNVGDGNKTRLETSTDQNTTLTSITVTNAQVEDEENIDGATTVQPLDDTLQMMEHALQKQGDRQVVGGERTEDTISEVVFDQPQDTFQENESRVVHGALRDRMDPLDKPSITGSEDTAQTTPLFHKAFEESRDIDIADAQPSSEMAPAVCAACRFARNSVAIEKDDNSTSWISCDACKAWFHFACAGFKNEREVRSVDKFRCRKCKPVHGATTYVRKSSRAHSAIDYAGLHQGVIKTSDESPEHHYIKPIKDGIITFLPENFARMRPELVTAEYFEKGIGMKEPIVIPARFNPQPKARTSSESQVHGHSDDVSPPNPLDDSEAAERWYSSHHEPESVPDQGQDGLDMVIPHGLTVRQVCELYGPEEKVEVIDVKSQNGENKKWNMRRWADYYENPNNKVVRNVISLEVSQSRLGRLIKRPKIVRDLDLQDSVWPEDLLAKGEYPRVQFYCLMSVADCFTDFHIDFGGSSVFYHILKGKKTFLFIPPKEKNLKKYEEWCRSPAQNWTFLGDQTKECYRVDLSEGDTMLIPAGWIHAVWTPEDSLVIGGNFLTRMNFAMQLRVAQIEKVTGVARKFRYPSFQKIQWHTALRYLDDDPLPNNVKNQLHSGFSFHREKPAYLEFDAWGENSRAGSENYHARYYAQSELDGLPDLVRYLLRTALIDSGNITDGISADTRNAVKKSIPRGHGHGEPLEVVKTFAAWVSWKRGDESIPHWAYPDHIPETFAPDKLSASAMKKLDREAALSAPRRQSARMQSQQEASEKLAASPDGASASKLAFSSNDLLTPTGVKRSSSDPDGLGQAESSTQKKPRTASGTGSAHRKTACESCRKRRRACKHKEQVAAMLTPQGSNLAPTLLDTATLLSSGPVDGLLATSPTTSSHTTSSTTNGIKVVMPRSPTSLELFNSELAKTLPKAISSGLPQIEQRTPVDHTMSLDPASPNTIQGRPRHKACNECRKSKVSTILLSL